MCDQKLRSQIKVGPNYVCMGLTSPWIDEFYNNFAQMFISVRRVVAPPNHVYTLEFVSRHKRRKVKYSQKYICPEITKQSSFWGFDNVASSATDFYYYNIYIDLTEFASTLF